MRHRTTRARIHVIAPGPTGGPGAMGEKILVRALLDAGHDATHVRLTREASGEQMPLFELGEQSVCRASQLAPPQAYFFSTIYTRQWVYLAETFAAIGVPMRAADRDDRSPLVVFGGQTSYAPEPIAAFADIVAYGDGEMTGVWIADLLAGGASRTDVMRAAHARGGHGYYVPGEWTDIDRPRLRRWEATEPLRPRTIHPGSTGDKNPTLEVARGCRSKCAFCPIGWAGGTYREADQRALREALTTIRTRYGRTRVNLFAPDYSSVSYVADLDRYAASIGCGNSGLDARLDRAERHLADGGTVKQFSFGIEGPSARLRAAIGKPLSSDVIVRVMERLRGVSVKWYVILGLPGETDDDIAELRDTIDRACAVHMGYLSITQTLLQPVPHTPLEDADGRYPEASAERALALRAWARNADGDGHRVMFSQPKGASLHEHDVALQRGDRSLAAYIERARPSHVRSGGWRDLCSKLGINVDAFLVARRRDAVSPWAFVDPGVPAEHLARAKAAYLARIGMREAAE